MSACECDPGTFENGWMETRCVSCVAREVSGWVRLPAIAREFSRSMLGVDS